MTITIPKKAIQAIQDDDAVLISRKEYEELRDKAANAISFPVVRLRGNAARKLDRRVAASLREYRQGKTQILHSLHDLM